MCVTITLLLIIFLKQNKIKTMKPQKLEKLEKLEKIAQLMGLKYDVKDNHKQFLDKGVRVFNGTLKTNSNNEINITDEDSEFGSSVKEEKLYTFEQVKEIASIKMNDLNTTDLEKAVLIIKGTAKNMCIKVETI
jgi:thiamine pyrophosphokinase